MRRGFTLIELMIAVAIVGILSAIAIPKFAKFQARSKQTEARVNLKAMFTAQRAFAAERDRFSKLVSEIGFAPERNNRYAYFTGQAGTQEDRSAALAVPLPDNTAVEFDSFRHDHVSQLNVEAIIPDYADGQLPVRNEIVQSPAVTLALQE